MSPRIAWGEALKHRVRFSGFSCRDRAISSSRRAPGLAGVGEPAVAVFAEVPAGALFAAGGGVRAGDGAGLAAGEAGEPGVRADVAGGRTLPGPGCEGGRQLYGCR